ncbi:MAG: ABC transporter ATP-binding protein [Oceanicoccus sp.]|uniref:ABC transporter ATP-binding protein n=1 Tax=Oceanicoccus sp. TaxID=2691044 RepID=UPI002621163F|nr:ABC transporter ATP-binding protein [Oceanicoccus sp.]MDG1773099.1 ABC transporter ATP-binding protein [Oceanicoccus sp.]
MKLQGKNLSLRLNSSAILNDVDITVDAGDFVGLIGPNGAGKTSLLRILANLQQADSGTIELNGHHLKSIHRKTLAQTLGYLEQGAPAHWPLLVRRLVELGRLPYLSPWGQLTGSDKAIVDNAMNQAEVQHLSERIISTLSGGERLRVLIARMFATEPNIVLADEPIAALDPYHQLHTMELFREHCDRGGSAVVVMHDLNMAARFCDRLVLLNQGVVACEGNVESVLTEGNLASVYGIHAQLDHQTTKGLTVIPTARIPH